MSKKQIDLRTPLQRQRDERNREIYKMYNEYMNNLPEDTSHWAVLRTIAEQFDMKPQGIRMVIKKMTEQTSV